MTSSTTAGGSGERLGLLRLHERIAVGGPVNVHFGWLVRAERLVAVKRLHPLHVAGEIGIALVHAEARLAMRVDHPNVVATLGVVRRPGEVLAVMEYVPGASLEEILGAAPGGLEPHVASAIVAGALRGLHAAHEARASVVPRRVSCARVLVGEDGRARVIDFDVGGPTTAGALVDELPYASPEQVVRAGVGVDVRRDVYAASVVLWETLTGRPLFGAPTVEGMLRKILSDAVPAPSRFAPWIRPDLDAVVLRGLARDPSDRFESASAMASDLERASSGSTHDVARALAAMDLACIRRRRVLAEAVRRREGNSLHFECSASAMERDPT